MLQWTGDLPPPQVPQEELRQEEKKDERCEPSSEELQPQGMQGQWLLLARHPADVSNPHIFSVKDCRTAHVSVIT